MNLGYTFGGSLFAFFSFRLFDGKNSDFLSSGKVLPVVEELEDLALYSVLITCTKLYKIAYFHVLEKNFVGISD